MRHKHVTQTAIELGYLGEISPGCCTCAAGCAVTARAMASGPRPCYGKSYCNS
ncbi:hypothetical protein [Microcoleus sp. F4-D5]|uniref:hypothetical protein n=1 Tax=Microcoleus sp. F4-D5 TaxID=2818760 RepID=UPI002FD2AEA9